MPHLDALARTLLPAGFAALGAVALLAGARTPFRSFVLVDTEVVEITASNTFEPKHLSVKAGQTVVWKNLSPRAHAVAADPAGAKPFRSGQIAPGGSYSRRFTTEGTYRYGCPDHRDAGMTGTILVKPVSKGVQP